MRLLLAAVLLALMPMQVLADVKLGEKKAQLCLLCHKPGNVMASAPLLEGQPAKYLVSATTAYKTGKRDDSVMRANVAALSAKDVRDISEYFASRPGPSGLLVADAAKAALGEPRVKELGCSTCHGATFSGSDVVPRLAGQATGYLISQLEAFSKMRRDHPPLKTPFSDLGDLEAVAHYFTSLK